MDLAISGNACSPNVDVAQPHFASEAKTADFGDGGVRVAKQVKEGEVRQPIGMQRASVWSPEVENAFRFQAAGWRSEEEYAAHYGPAQRWPRNQFIKTLQAKQNGYYMHFRSYRECEDKHLNRVKLFIYE